jgi:hypothetical protein
MGKPNRATQPQKRAAAGKHGGNRAGDHDGRRRGEKRSRQAAGKDPLRTKGR